MKVWTMVAGGLVFYRSLDTTFGGAKLFKMPFGRVCSFFLIMIGIVNVGYQLNRTRSHHRDEDLVCQYGSF